MLPMSVWFTSGCYVFMFMWKQESDLHVCGVRLQAADDHADGGGQQVGDVP